MKIIITTVKRECLLLLTALMIGLLFTAAFTKAYADSALHDLSSKFIRLHVIANSDIQEDQQLKLKVRDAVMGYLQNKVETAADINETRKIIESSLKDIADIAEKTIKEEGYNYSATASLKRMRFPTKYYGDFTLVAGEYEALSIEIGGAKGENWWCVVYPPLCFVDVATNDDKSKEILKKELTDEQYSLVTESEKPSVKIKFKAIELWQQRKL